MAIYADSLPYMTTQMKRVVLPRTDTANRLGFGNLVFPFTTSVGDTIHMINNKENLYHDNKYYYYYYNLLYRGSIMGRRYNIKNVDDRKLIYERITKETPLHAHPPSLLNKTPNRNCIFEMSKYIGIYQFMTEKYTPKKRMEIFWSFFKSIWFSEQTNGYDKKCVVINADLFRNFNGSLKTCIDNPVFMLYYTLYKQPELIMDMDIDFFIYCKNAVLRVNPSKCNEKSYVVLKKEIKKVYSKVSKVNMDILDETNIDKDEQKEELKESLMTRYNFTGKKEESEVTDLNKAKKEVNATQEEKIKETIQKKVDEKIDKNLKHIESIVPEVDSASKEVTDYVKAQTEIELDDDKDLIESMYNMMKTQKSPTKTTSTARDEILRKKQEEVTLNGLTVKEIERQSKQNRVVPTKDVSKSIKNINENVKTVKFANLNKDYIENTYQKDIVKTFTALNNKSSKFYVKSINVKDSSNELNYKDTYTIVLEDENRKRHSITVDIPKFLDNKFLYLGGNKKIINRQNFLLPVVKTASDTVQIVTNYNKMFIRRLGTKSISAVERIMKLIQSDEETLKYFTVGNNSAINKSYLTTIEYDEIGKVLTKFKSDKSIFFFNQKEAKDYVQLHNIEYPKNGHFIFIGVKNNENMFINADTQTTSNGQTICDLLVTELPQEMQNMFNKTRSTKKLMYNTVTIMAQTIPFIVLLIYWEGITSVFNKMHLKYYFSKSYPKEVKTNESVIRFKDAYFVYEGDLATNLLLNGIKVLDTENYNMEDYNTQEPYLDYFKKVYGKVSIVNTLYNAYDFTIDPITEEILKVVNLPTDLVELCIYASNLLADESYTIENSQRIARVRSLEVIPSILYNQISRAFIAYKNSGGNKKLSIPKDAVIKQLMALQTVEDYSTLNPVVELEKDRAITAKGYRGVNVDRAYSEEKRSYDESMIGIISMNTSPDGNCGINRFLTMEPNITTTRGFVDIKDDKKEELKDANLFSPAELLYPLGNTRDDSIRTSMAAKQSKHVIPVKNSIPALISNGYDESIRFNLSSDFVVNADEDGTIIDVNEKSGVMIAEYKSGKRRAIDLSPHVVKNGGGGFWLNNQLITKLKVGDKFKKDDVLAYHKDFFTDDQFNGVRMNVGVLEKVAITSSYDTYNDSAYITHKLAKDAESSMTFCKQAVIGKNSNIYSIKNVGDHVEIGDSLIDFDVSFEDNELNKLLSHLSDENKEVLEENSTNSIKSKYAGTIIDIKIYSPVELEELSESLQKVVKSYYNRVENKKKFVSKYDTEKNNSIVKCGLLLNESTGKVEPNMYGVIKGQKVQDSVLIEFYIEHSDIMGCGDKLAFFTALKGYCIAFVKPL